MQRILTILGLTTIFLTAGMDKPSPLTPLSTPTKVKKELYRTLHEAIEGKEADCDIENVNPTLWQQSPKSFAKSARRLFESKDEQELKEKKGITSELVNELLPEAICVAQQEGRPSKIKPLNSRLKGYVEKAAQLLGIPVPHVQAAELDNPGECRGDTIYLDEKHLYHEAPTPDDVIAIIAHEMWHLVKRDYYKSCALSMAHDVVGVTESPMKRTKRTRIAETFADVEPSSVSPVIARAAKQLTALTHARYGDGHASTHSSEKHRKVLAELTDKLHQAEAKKVETKSHPRDAWDE